MTEAVTLGQTAGGIVYLVVLIAMAVLTFLAYNRILNKAGYSSAWMIVPLVAVGLWISTWILLVVDVRTVAVGPGVTATLPVSLSDFAVLEVFDLLSVFATWVLFLVFAFSDWPATSGQSPRPYFVMGPRVGDMPPPSGAAVGAGTMAPPPPTPVPSPTGAAAAGPAVAVAEATPTVTAEPPGMAEHQDVAERLVRASTPGAGVVPNVIYCSWCGKARAVDAHAIHHCGSKTRPPVYCMKCGTVLMVDAESCTECGTPTTEVSRTP